MHGMVELHPFLQVELKFAIQARLRELQGRLKHFDNAVVVKQHARHILDCLELSKKLGVDLKP